MRALRKERVGARTGLPRELMRPGLEGSACGELGMSKLAHVDFHHPPPLSLLHSHRRRKAQQQLRRGAAAAPLPAGRRNLHRSILKTGTDHEDRPATIFPVVLRNNSPQPISKFVHCTDWARHKLLFASRRRFAAVGTNDGRGPPPIASPLHCESNETIPTNFHQVLEDIRNLQVFAVAGIAPPFPPPPGGRSPPDNHLCSGLPVANKTTRLDSDNGAPPEMASFTLNPDDFPPLTTNPSESTHTNSSKMTTFQQGQNAENAAANRLAKDFNFSKFFLANSNPPPIGATQDINGRPTVIFSDSETQSLAAHFRLALIGKFSQDFTRLWLRRIWYLNGFPIRIFKWTPTFTPEQESSIIPIWVSFSELPAHLYRKDALYAIANNISTPLQIADSTLNQSNLVNARVCVEIDLLKPLLKEIDLKICGATIVQNIVKTKMKEKAVAQYVIKGKNVVEYQARQVFDKIPEEKLTVTEDGENVELGWLMLKMMLLFINLSDFDAEKEDELYVVHEKETENLIRDSIVYVETVEKETCKEVNVEATFEVMNRTHAIEANIGCDENLSVAFEIDAKDSLETGKKRIKVDSVFRLLQTVKQVGVVMKGIKVDVEEAIKRNRLAVSSAILFQKCVLLYDPISQRYLKPLDTGEQSHQREVSKWAGAAQAHVWTGAGASGPDWDGLEWAGTHSAIRTSAGGGGRAGGLAALLGWTIRLAEGLSVVDQERPTTGPGISFELLVAGVVWAGLRRRTGSIILLGRLFLWAVEAGPPWAVLALGCDGLGLLGGLMGAGLLDYNGPHTKPYSWAVYWACPRGPCPAHGPCASGLRFGPCSGLQKLGHRAAAGPVGLDGWA
ncbi:UNVERIFIED_CONTAM: hypothetical protein Scaly_2863000 [Sesamum calycinum]|uniref:DUF4283 domain-containing protein n=1 Tax=Sesamum calycinum TaxID=2727403 RepID=A0AAW2LFN4_9LAMI